MAVSGVRAKVRRRVERLSTPELLDRADQAGSGMARALQDYRRHGTVESLHEAEQGVVALDAVLEVLLERHV